MAGPTTAQQILRLLDSNLNHGRCTTVLVMQALANTTWLLGFTFVRRAAHKREEVFGRHAPVSFKAGTCSTHVNSAVWTAHKAVW
jgi:hypothetical protein